MTAQMEFFAEDEKINIVPNFPLPGPSENVLACMAVRQEPDLYAACFGGHTIFRLEAFFMFCV